mgnify:CR=1 FL=1
MNLLLMYHAEAETRQASAVEFDAERPLSPRGKRQARRVADALAAVAMSPGKVLSSPFIRAQETAHVVAASSGSDIAVEPITLLAPGVGTRDVLDVALNDGAESGWTLIVLHEPDVSTLINELIGLNATVEPGDVFAVRTHTADGRTSGRLLFSLASAIDEN